MNTTDQTEYLDFNFELPARNGKIITFYSFKGGVGRTMALANTAFLAASHGKRVLVMDWDLEAPGLAYYFRGVQEPSVARELRSSPGILNVLWDWVHCVQSGNKEDVEKTTEKFDSGQPFQECVRELVDPEFFEASGGGIDYISAGSPKILTPHEIDYEEALARFPWHDFFSQLAGGYVPFALRKWAKENYDLILIDSRTGLAESAGVCTMQLPDTVALCFVLNRQNIEGISKIAAVIRQQKPDTILLAAPMRVSREGTSEESEARAKAITDLTRLGGFLPETAQQQLQSLAIKHADNVPFYESLAPIVAEDPEVDPICLNYLRFAREVTGQPDIGLVKLDEQLLSRARARLQPQLATSEYVEKLLGSEPLRAATELQALISSAEELVANGEHAELSYDYLKVLTGVAFDHRTMHFAVDSDATRHQALNILRMLHEHNSEWGSSFISAIEMHLVLGNTDSNEELALREELDALYPQTHGLATDLRRLDNRRHIAQLYSELDENEVAHQTATEVLARVRELRDSNSLEEEAHAEITFLETDMLSLMGSLADEAERLDAAKVFWMEAIESCANVNWESARPDLKRTISDVHAKLALRSRLDLSLADRQEHALAAARISKTGISSPFFVGLLQILSHTQVAPSLLQFLELTLGSFSPQSRVPLALTWGRSQVAAVRLIGAFVEAVVALEPLYGQSEVSTILQRMATVVDATILQIGRRRTVVGGRSPIDVVSSWEQFMTKVSQLGAQIHPSDDVLLALRNLTSEFSRGTRGML